MVRSTNSWCASCSPASSRRSAGGCPRWPDHPFGSADKFFPLGDQQSLTSPQCRRKDEIFVLYFSSGGGKQKTLDQSSSGGHLSPDRGNVGQCVRAARHGCCGRISVGHVRGGRRLSHHPAADLLQHSSGHRGGDRRQPGHRLVLLGRARPHEAGHARLQARHRAAGRRPGRLDARRLCVCVFARGRPARPVHLAVLCGDAWHRRRPDDGRERARAAGAPGPGPRRR